MGTITTNKFYSVFWTNQACREIFLLHKEQLLEKKEVGLPDNNTNYYLPRIVISNSRKREGFEDKLEQRVENRNIELSYDLNSVTQRNIDQQKLEEYFKKKFGKPINEITQRIDKSKFEQARFLSEVATSIFSEKRLLAFLRKYQFIPDEVKSVEELAKYVETFLKSEINNLLTPERIIDFLNSLDQIAGTYHNVYLKDLLEADRFYVDVLYDVDNFKERIKTFDLLFEAGVLLGGKYKAYYECVNCPPDTFAASATINLMPSDVKLKCPKCGNSTFYLVPYLIHAEIFNHIIAKDGVLINAIKYLLEKRNTKYLENHHLLNDVESDLVLLNEVNNITDIIEVKMFKSDRPGDTIESNLAKGLSDFFKAIKKLIESNPNYGTVKYHYVTNIKEEAYYTELARNFKASISNVQVMLYSPDLFKKTHFNNV